MYAHLETIESSNMDHLVGKIEGPTGTHKAWTLLDLAVRHPNSPNLQCLVVKH